MSAFSVPWSAPAPRMREYVQAIRAIWDCWKNGSPLDYQGGIIGQFDDPEFHARTAQWRIAKNSDRSRGPGNDESRGGRMGRCCCTPSARKYGQMILPKLRQS